MGKASALLRTSLTSFHPRLVLSKAGSGVELVHVTPVVCMSPGFVYRPTGDPTPVEVGDS